jgi:hypothetical protein
MVSAEVNSSEDVEVLTPQTPVRISFIDKIKIVSYRILLP